jgi:phosphoribosylaminoimidazolecarboxamide formyltransferase/IMP cyclohydrolase
MGESMTNFPKRALISVSDKTGIVEFARELIGLGFEILSTGGTYRFLEHAHLPVTEVSTYTQFPEMMDGRVKTLHPRIHGAILGRPHMTSDVTSMQEHGIVPFTLVVVNLYPFEQTIAKHGVTLDDAIENIDIGGPSMVRSAAKNHEAVGIITNPSQYHAVIEALKQGDLPIQFKRELAARAFEMTYRYDHAIARYFNEVVCRTLEELTHPPTELDKFPGTLELELHRKMTLRHGENPHQLAAFYTDPDAPKGTLANAEQFHGKELSYNNMLDLDSALLISREFTKPAVAILKHNNPCGCAQAETLSEAFQWAYAGDPVSAFGSIIGMNRILDTETAEQLCLPDRFVEAIIAPDYTTEAIQLLTTKPKWKKNVRLLRAPHMLDMELHELDYRRVTGGLLLQTRDIEPDPQENYKVVTDRKPTDQEEADLVFAMKVCKHVKSNAIVLVKNEMLLGAGAGQMSRLDSCRIAVEKAGDRSLGSVVASDAFFPFRDGVDTLAKSGITAIIQPGGSVKDQEVIDACNEHDLAMIFTGRRHFRH